MSIFPHQFFRFGRRLPKYLIIISLLIFLIGWSKKVGKYFHTRRNRNLDSIPDPNRKSDPNQYIFVGHDELRINISLGELDRLEKEAGFTYEKLSQWDETLCGKSANQRGRNQKVVAVSMFGTTSKFSNNPMYAWNTTIMSFLIPLADEIRIQLPTWTLRVYVDFTGSASFQRDILYNISNTDICDMTDIPFFGSSLLSYLPGKFWRFLPVFDPYVDYVISSDLDSPMVRRQSETIELWLSEEEKNNFFYIARDHDQHAVSILGGLWGAATVRARQHLFDIFRLILVPSIGRRYINAGDQRFLDEIVWNQVKNNSLIFDSHYCKLYGGRPFLSQRPKGNCFLGCIRACCLNNTDEDSGPYIKASPVECRPADHPDWTYS